MHAYLITGYNKQKIEEKIDSLIEKNESRRLGFELKKIADVRELGKFVNLTVAEKSAMVIENIDEASSDAQNAFLKNLEEPQENLIYILTASSSDSVLPTILSRCQLIEVADQKPDPEEESIKNTENFLDMTIGERLKEASKITKREDAALFMQTIIFVLHRRLKENQNLVETTELALETLKKIEANGNVSLQLTNFAINA